MQDRIEFEKWLLEVHMLEGTWNEQRNCYNEYPCHLAYCAWRAARPKPMTFVEIAEMAEQEQFLLICDGLEELQEIVRSVEQFRRTYT